MSTGILLDSRIIAKALVDGRLVLKWRLVSADLPALKDLRTTPQAKGLVATGSTLNCSPGMMVAHPEITQEETLETETADLFQK